MEIEGLSRLEEIVSRLLSQYADLKKENEALSAELASKQQEFEQLQATVQEMHGDKDEVHQRLSSILAKLEQWEEAVDTADQSAESAPAAETSQESDSQKQLFNMGA